MDNVRKICYWNVYVFSVHDVTNLSSLSAISTSGRRQKLAQNVTSVTSGQHRAVYCENWRRQNISE